MLLLLLLFFVFKGHFRQGFPVNKPTQQHLKVNTCHLEVCSYCKTARSHFALKDTDIWIKTKQLWGFWRATSQRNKSPTQFGMCRITVPVIESCSVHTPFKHSRLEHPAPGLLRACDAFAVIEQPTAECQALGKVADSHGNTSCVPGLFLQDKGSDCIVQKIPFYKGWSGNCCAPSETLGILLEREPEIWTLWADILN